MDLLQHDTSEHSWNIEVCVLPKISFYTVMHSAKASHKYGRAVIDGLLWSQSEEDCYDMQIGMILE